MLSHNFSHKFWKMERAFRQRVCLLDIFFVRCGSPILLRTRFRKFSTHGATLNYYFFDAVYRLLLLTSWQISQEEKARLEENKTTKHYVHLNRKNRYIDILFFKRNNEEKNHQKTEKRRRKMKKKNRANYITRFFSTNLVMQRRHARCILWHRRAHYSISSKYVPTTNGRNHSKSCLHQNQKSLAFAWARLQVQFFRFSQRKEGGFKTCSKTMYLSGEKTKRLKIYK
jgi:hypothetical protein